MNTFYTVLEIQANDGTKACIPVIYDDRNQAMAKYHTILAAAAVSQIDYHAAAIMDSNGAMVAEEHYDRRSTPGQEE